MNRKDVIRFLIFRTLGNFLVLFMIFGFLATFGAAVYYEVLFQYGKFEGVKFSVASSSGSAMGSNKINSASKIANKTAISENSPTSNGLLSAILSGQKEQVLIPPSTAFSVVIPKIGAAEEVTPNVDPSNPQDYLPVLQHSIAHAKGSAFPGLDGTTYLFAHSADNFWDVGRYNAVFYLLKDLSVGDEIVVFFQNRRYNYYVYHTEIVDPTDVSNIAADIGGGERVILQTCWPPGTSWKRLLVFARPKE